MRRTTLTTALGLTLSGLVVLAGCSTDGGTGTDTETSASDTAGTSAAAEGENAGETAGSTADAAMSDPVCADFFQTGTVTLAERATTDRDVLASGETLDPASWGEISLLNQRIAELGEQAEGDQAALLERINAPFVEATDAVLSDDAQSPTDPEITVPEIDVTDAAAAQDEFQAACEG